MLQQRRRIPKSQLVGYYLSLGRILDLPHAIDHGVQDSGYVRTTVDKIANTQDIEGVARLAFPARPIFTDPLGQLFQSRQDRRGFTAGQFDGRDQRHHAFRRQARGTLDVLQFFRPEGGLATALHQHEDFAQGQGKHAQPRSGGDAPRPDRSEKATQRPRTGREIVYAALQLLAGLIHRLEALLRRPGAPGQVPPDAFTRRPQLFKPPLKFLLPAQVQLDDDAAGLFLSHDQSPFASRARARPA